ncbi:hypothetical protein CA850_29070 [Micromonospora echinospora]|uniref:DUF397 domain-containing protein n=1 Tax=Micromonospora echinospora TaxID=1877 RepID=A0A1C4UW21_MICEC|nr:DUF397 domain-containing protein [Micromonospora echinospora]OZV75181.1 hypothetical protein CA850_29070 [Micromonospora echinospora]SCE75860.1 protein of unknown function [Micromonospora echinospora]
MNALDSQWRTSSHSGGNGACLEARYADHTTQVRDTKDRQGPVLVFGPAQWTGFVEGIKASAFEG